MTINRTSGQEPMCTSIDDLFCGLPASLDDSFLLIELLSVLLHLHRGDSPQSKIFSQETRFQMSWPDVGGRKIQNTHHGWGWRGPNTYVHVNSRAACWQCGFRALSTTQRWLGSDNTDGVAAGLHTGMKWRPGEFSFLHTHPPYSAKARKNSTSGSSHCMGPSIRAG